MQTISLGVGKSVVLEPVPVPVHVPLANVVVPGPTPYVADTVEADVDGPISFDIQLLDILDSLGKVKQCITQVQNKVRVLEKTVHKEQKQNAKLLDKRNKSSRKPSGFAKPAFVSDELCSFMKLDKGSQIARTEVTQYIIKYINQQNLQDPTQKKFIKPDPSLKSLLGIKDTDEVTYFNIQKFMNKHFISQ